MLNKAIHRTQNYYCRPLPPSEVEAWFRLMDLIVRPREYAMLCEIDLAYRKEMNAELELLRVRNSKQPPGNNSG